MINVNLETATADKSAPAKPVAKMKVICGANVETLENAGFTSVATLRRNMKEVLNIGNEHVVVLINGQTVGTVDEGKIILEGNEEIEFKKPSGEKG